MMQTELLPVPTELVPQAWNSVRRVCLRKIPGYDVERAHIRLLLGIDQLWCAYHPQLLALTGVVITNVSEQPPSDRPCFRRSDPFLMRSLTIHFAGESMLGTWLPSAVERLNRYARQQDCRQLFLMMRKSWAKCIVPRIWSPKWEGVAITRDRPTKSIGPKHRLRNTPGYYRPMVPLPPEQWSRHKYGVPSKAYFKLEAAA